ncbi:MAG TPA: hypothetical protein VF472_12550 [Burkholderiaceae bacterium]
MVTATSARRPTLRRWLLITLLASPVLYLGSCEYLSTTGRHAFDGVRVGNTKTEVIQRLGLPYHVQKAGEDFNAYASDRCSGACTERLWFRNPLSVGIEAWSLDMGQDGRVVNKAYWISP